MHTETHEITTDDEIAISLRERSANDPTAAVVFVHGATYAGRSIFDPIGAPEYSWLVWGANAGLAAFAVDIRGYGDSQRPPGMDASTHAGEPPVRAIEATEDVRAAIRTVRERFSCPVHLVGTSWGSMISGAFLAGSKAPDLASVTLHAPVFEPAGDLVDGFVDGVLEPFRTVGRMEARSRWNEQVPSDPPARIRGGTEASDPAFEAFWKSLVSSGQGIDGEDAIVAPNGTLQDLREASRGNHLYEPSDIDVPTLVIRGSLDPTATREDALRIYDGLDVPDDESAYVEIEGGTHFVHLERRRTALYEAVDAFRAGVEG